MRAVLAVLIASAGLAGQERISGPEPGRALPAIRVYAQAGPDAGTELDLAERLGKDSGLLLFVHELTRETAPVIRACEDMARERRLLGLRYWPILLHVDRTEGETRLQAVNRSLRMENPLVLSLDGVEGPGELALNRKCALTLLVVRDGRVVRSLGLTDTGQKDVPRLRDLVAETLGKLPETDAEWSQALMARLPADAAGLRGLVVELLREQRRLDQRLREVEAGLRDGRGRMPPGQVGPRGEAAPMARDGKPPEDPGLRDLLRPFIAKDASDGDVNSVYLEMLAQSKGKPELEGQVTEMLRMVTSLGYGSDHARRLAGEHVRKADAARGRR